MAQTDFDVVGIGNAIVDVLSKADDGFLTGNRLTKGAMTLIDAAKAEVLYAAMGPAIECSGGSAANTMVGLASLGGRAGYVGKIAADQLGDVFRHDIRSAGVTYATPPAKSGPATARCLIFVTPDAQRTMQTYLGACVELGPDDVPEKMIAGASVTYLEGYLWDKPAAKDAFRKAMKAAHDAKRKVALTLSDPFCVERHRTEFRDLVDHQVDILFANEAELISLYRAKDFDEALTHVQRHRNKIMVVTRSEKGSVVCHDGNVNAIPAEKVTRVVDTTGAGDLYGLSQQMSLTDCARVGGIAAAEIISHFGARPEVPLRTLVQKNLKRA